MTAGQASARSGLVPRPSSLRPALVVLGLVGAVAVGMLGIVFGPAEIPADRALLEIGDRLGLPVESGLDARRAAVIWELRLPRVVLGGLVGAMLASAGAAYQGVFRNPLADPYLLGVAAGAGLGATLAIAYGGGTEPTVELVPPAAFLGGLTAVIAAYVLAVSAGGRRGGRTGATFIVAGVAVTAFFTALQTFVQQREAETFREVFAWILGRLSTVGWGEVGLIAPYVLVTGTLLLLHRRLLDTLSVGDEEARSLGIEVGRVRALVVVAATLGTAAAVAVSGLIGFVGIIVPHTIRLAVGWSYRIVLPLSMLLGAAFLIGADLLARMVLAPAEVPIGVVTAFFGAPFFAIVLKLSRRGTT